jgi:hypothetical protein
MAVRGLRADRDKVTRAVPAAVRMQVGQVYLPAGHPELAAIEAELLAFPNGKHDDIVDCLAYAAAEVYKRGRGPTAAERVRSAIARAELAVEAAEELAAADHAAAKAELARREAEAEWQRIIDYSLFYPIG